MIFFLSIPVTSQLTVHSQQNSYKYNYIDIFSYRNTITLHIELQDITFKKRKQFKLRL